MSRTVFLDTGPLGLVTMPHRSRQSDACNAWLHSLLLAGQRIIIPEIADYELRRELMRAKKKPGLRKLDALAENVEYLPINTDAMRKAAEMWAEARQRGKPTADDKSLDADMVLIGQAATLGDRDYVVATSNVGHLALFVPAQEWHTIQPDIN